MSLLSLENSHASVSMFHNCPSGKRAPHLQGHGLQKQHAEGVCERGAEGEGHGETQQRCGGKVTSKELKGELEL